MNTAQGISGTLLPMLTQQAQGGIPAAQLNAMNTAAQQSAGGSMAAAEGQGALMEARTRNSGAANPAIEESARNAMRTGSQAAVQNQLANWQAMEQGRNALQGLYGTNLNASNAALGLSNNAIGNWTQAAGQTTGTWLPIVQGAMQGLRGPLG